MRAAKVSMMVRATSGRCRSIRWARPETCEARCSSTSSFAFCCRSVSGDTTVSESAPAVGCLQLPPVTLYDLLHVEPGCSLDQLRVAYRLRARELHPDLGSVDDGGLAMAKVNDAWRVLSDPVARRDYDAQFVVAPGPAPTENRTTASQAVRTPQPAPEANRTRRQAWVAGVQAQIYRLSRLAGRSATQTLLVRSTRAPRPVYEDLVEKIVAFLVKDTEARVRAARAAGAAPLDLGVAATLVGLRSMADSLRREATLGVTGELQMIAELVDRMWDVLAHELPHELTVALGGNPRLAATLRQ